MQLLDRIKKLYYDRQVPKNIKNKMNILRDKYYPPKTHRSPVKPTVGINNRIRSLVGTSNLHTGKRKTWKQLLFELAPNKRMGLTPDLMKDDLYRDIVNKLENFKIRYP